MANRVKQLLQSGVAALASFLFGAAVVAFARDPVMYTVIPQAMASVWPGPSGVLTIFDAQQPGPYTEPDARYAVYISGIGPEISGRIVRRIDGVDETDQQSFVTGVKRDNVMTFTYRSVRDGRTGTGAFFGVYDPQARAYVGSLIGFSRDDNGGSCTVDRFWAVIGGEHLHAQLPLLISRAAAGGVALSAPHDPTGACPAVAASGSEAPAVTK